MREYMTYEELAYMGVIPANNELYHHGILGMRWGRKNGPPYPLPYGRHSSSEKRAGWKDSLANVAKATGKGVATLARGTARAVKGTVGGVNKASIRLGLKPKKMMSNEELDAEIARIQKEDILKHLRGKKTDMDRLAAKLDKQAKRREAMKVAIQDTLKTIGTKVIGEGLATDLKNRLNLASNKRADKYAVERAELYPDFDFGGKVKKKDRSEESSDKPPKEDQSGKEKKSKEKKDTSSGYEDSNVTVGKGEKIVKDASSGVQNGSTTTVKSNTSSTQSGSTSSVNNLTSNVQNGSTKAVDNNSKTLTKLYDGMSRYGLEEAYSSKNSRSGSNALSKETMDNLNAVYAMDKAFNKRTADAGIKLHTKNDKGKDVYGAAAKQVAMSRMAEKMMKGIYLEPGVQDVDYFGGKITYKKNGKDRTIDLNFEPLSVLEKML